MAIAIIGGGMFGTMTAMKLAEAGEDVTLYERKPELMTGTSYNNQNRLHLGFHYPRDRLTAEQCIRGFQLFKDMFPAAILGDFQNAYFIASEGSNTTPENFVKFCDDLNLRYDVLDLDRFSPEVRKVDFGVLTDEVVYDCGLVRDEVRRRMARSAVRLRTSHDVSAIRRSSGGFKLSFPDHRDAEYTAVVNCCYADVNRLTGSLGHTLEQRRFQYTAVPIIEFDTPQPVGITIMDGQYMTLLPFGKTGRYLLYHVGHVVIGEDIAYEMKAEWRDEATSPFAGLDKERFFTSMRDACAKFVPAVKDARLTGFLNAPRMILANTTTDSRPSFVNAWEAGYVTVFSGKIDCATWVSDDVVSMLGEQGLLGRGSPRRRFAAGKQRARVEA